MNHPFDTLRPEYENLLATMRVQRPLDVDNVARKLTQDNVIGRYLTEQTDTGVPAALLAALDQRESDASPYCGLGQGDPWNKVSTHVPRGKGPFGSKVEADEFYIRYDHLDDLSTPAYTWPYVCWKGEAWNGFGPRGHGIYTSYLWGGTQHYVKGKYVADNVWDSKYVDRQLGIVPVMMRIIALMPVLAFDKSLAFGHTDAPPLQPQPVPMGVGGALPADKVVPEDIGGPPHDTKWLQDTLNRTYLMPNEKLVVDGSYGRRTREAVRSFQRFNQLEADGLFGPKTDHALTTTLALRAGPGGRQTATVTQGE